MAEMPSPLTNAQAEAVPTAPAMLIVAFPLIDEIRLIKGRLLLGRAAEFALRPGDYDLGSPQFRATSRSLAEAKKKPKKTIQIVFVSPNSAEGNGPLIEIPPVGLLVLTTR